MSVKTALKIKKQLEWRFRSGSATPKEQKRFKQAIVTLREVARRFTPTSAEPHGDALDRIMSR